MESVVNSRGSLFLASASPRRKAMLEAAGLTFRSAGVDVDERPRQGELAPDYVVRIAAEKAEAGAALGTWCLGSDTAVVLGDRILGKPADADEAVKMLLALAGRGHTVMTAFSLRGPDGRHDALSRTTVRFRQFSRVEAEAYVATGASLDKAGAYGIQGAAAGFVEAFEGDFDAVVGLPLRAVLEQLEASGAIEEQTAVQRNLAVAKGRIAAAEQGARRASGSTRLVVATKGHSAAAVAALVGHGQRRVGESYVQEWQAKQAAVSGAEWHFLGRIQRNKARLIARAACVHGVASVRAAEAIGAAATDGPVPILLQVNIDAEPSKAGFSAEALMPAATTIARIDGVSLRGLMVLPKPGPVFVVRDAFERTRLLSQALLRQGLLGVGIQAPELSMGMSGDYAFAIGQGATYVRLGTAIMGPRP